MTNKKTNKILTKYNHGKVIARTAILPTPPLFGTNAEIFNERLC